MRIAFVDLETIGLPRQPSFDEYYSYTDLKCYDNARIIQIAVLIYDIDNFVEASSDIKTSKKGNTKKSNKPDLALETKEVATHVYVIKPDGFVVRNTCFHKITQKIADETGVAFEIAIGNIWEDLKECDLFVSHNVLFDKNVLLSELHRYDMKEVLQKVESTNSFCTSKGCERITKLRFNSTQYKQPKLSELYKFLFKKNVEILHNAYDDTRILVECFMELVKKRHLVFSGGLWKADVI